MQQRTTLCSYPLGPLFLHGAASPVSIQQAGWNMPEKADVPGYRLMLSSAEPEAAAEVGVLPQLTAVLGFENDSRAI